MQWTRERTAAGVAGVAAAVALGVAFAAEDLLGLVPCALCLVERWPYRVAIALSVLALLLPRRLARLVLVLVALTALADVAVAAVHIGVEQKWWPSPLPECEAPRFSGGSIADRLRSMPALPSKSCEDPTYLIPFLPVSMTTMNFLYALAITLGIATFLGRTRSEAR
jgi:disulfide bond formation protein DsbB